MSAPLISATHVHEMFRNSLAEVDDPDELDDDKHVVVHGIVFNVAFRRAEVDKRSADIAGALMGLPQQFRKSEGGGWSFLNACDDRNGLQWTGEHRTMSMLFSLGEAAGLVSCLLPREMWPALPGGMPYYQVDDVRCAELIQSAEAVR